MMMKRKGWIPVERFHEYRALQCTNLMVSEHSGEPVLSRADTNPLGQLEMY